MCYLVFKDIKQQERIGAELAETFGADDRRSLSEVREGSAEGLVRALHGNGKPVQVTDGNGGRAESRTPAAR